MAIVDGNFITIYQGETLDMVFAVVDEDNAAYDLTGGAAVLTYRKRGTTAVNVTGTISTSNVTVSFAHATTQLLVGNYDYQLMCRDASNKIIMVREGQLTVRISLNPDAVAVP